MSSTTLPTVEPYPGWAEEDNRALILGVQVSMIGLAFLFVIARLYSRMVAIGRLGLDDYIVMFCIVVGMLYLALTSVSVSYGFGRHMATLPPDNIRRAIKFLIISFEPGILLFSMPKFAVVILLFKILHPGPRHRVVLWVISVLFGIMMVGNLVLNLAQCSPAAAQWGDVQGVCWDRRVAIDYSIVFAAFSAWFDFYLAIYPTIVMFRQMLNWKKKLALSSALGFGYCAGGVAVYKTYTLSEPPIHMIDFTYDVDKIVLWTTVEGTCVLIGACIPCLYPLVKKIFGARALGTGSTPNPLPQGQGAMVTIGGTPQFGLKRAAKAHLGLSGIDTVVDEGEGEENWHCVTLEDRADRADAAEQWAADAVAELEMQLRRVEQGRTPTPHEWV